MKEEMRAVKIFFEGTLSPTVSSCSSVKESTFAIRLSTSRDLGVIGEGRGGGSGHERVMEGR